MRFALAALIVSLLGQAVSSRTTAFDQPINDSYRVRGVVTYRYQSPNVCCTTSLNIALVDRQNPRRYWTIADLDDEFEISVALERFDERSLVIARSDPNHGTDEGRVKLFFDTRSKRLLKQVAFGTPASVSFKDDAQARALLGLSAEGVARFRAASTTPVTLPADDPVRNAVLAKPLRQTTYEEFARDRPGRVADGYVKESTTIEDAIGPFVRAADGVWFGKTFYDGEGTTGVGGIGVVTAAGNRLLRIPELFDWSVSSLMVEPDTIWVGRVGHPEGGDYSGGLLEYNRRSRKTVVHPVPDVITSVARIDGALFLETTHGLYVLRGNTQRRFRMEPDLAGKMVVVEQLPSPKP